MFMNEESPPGNLFPLQSNSMFQMGQSLLIFQFPNLTHIMSLIDILHWRKDRTRGCSNKEQPVFLSIKVATSCLIESSSTKFTMDCVWILKMLLIGASSPVSVFNTSAQEIPVENSHAHQSSAMWLDSEQSWSDVILGSMACPLWLPL